MRKPGVSIVARAYHPGMLKQELMMQTYVKHAKGILAINSGTTISFSRFIEAQISSQNESPQEMEAEALNTLTHYNQSL